VQMRLARRVVGEGVGTALLLATVVGSGITAAYWFTASTSFANPAVTLARAFTDTFAGIRPIDVPGFVVAQIAGAVVATALFRWLVPGLPKSAAASSCRMPVPTPPAPTRGPRDAEPRRALTAEPRSHPGSSRRRPMRKVQVFDPPMCCPTGVCGPSVDPVLPRFAADLDWLKGQGFAVERYNLSQEPAAFVENTVVNQKLFAGGDVLPLVLLDGQIIAEGAYPTRAALAERLGLAGEDALRSRG
jgi:arsenical resistance operon trans-acting repressor ArsD/major intrinsic protein